LKTPSAGTPIGLLDLLAAGAGRAEDGFQLALSRLWDVPWCRLTGSGTAALYAALRVLAARSSRRQILLPAYTAPSLILPIRKAGLEPVLADVSLSSFNSGAGDLLDRVNEQTLAVLPVHMFGLPIDMDGLVSGVDGTGVMVIEDACSAMGSEMGNRQAGTLGDIGFHSFNRGKNLSTVAGGALVAACPDLRAALEREIAAFDAPGLQHRLRNAAYAGGLAAAVRPWGYTLLQPLLSGYKYTTLHTDFHTRTYTGFQSRLGNRLLGKWDTIRAARVDNGDFLRQALSGVGGATQAEVLDDTVPVYNQYPVLMPDENYRDRAHRAICETGLEATVLYPDPIHRIYEDVWPGTRPDPFPNATEMSRRLLLIPVHPLVPRRALERAVDALDEAMRS
jgi:perosamine synthetase